MTTKRNVLVFPCGSEIGLEIYESVSFSTHFKLFGASSVADHGEFVYENYIADAPFVTDVDFIEKINKIVTENNIEYIFPAHDSVVLSLALAKSEGKLSCDVITSNYNTCDIARSKFKTYQVLDQIVPTPLLYDSQTVKEAIFPVFLKPDVGQGSKGVHIAKSIDEVAFYIGQDKSLLVMEYLPGKEYTIDCFTDFRGNLRYCSGRVRSRISNGISVSAVAVVDNRFEELANRINSKIEFDGAWFFQVKENKDKELVLMEVAPRIAGTMGYDRVKGVNLALLSLYNAANIEVDIMPIDYEVVTDRALKALYKHNLAYKHVYIDLDDLIIYDGKVNTRLAAFLYQCHNDNIKVYLLSKHTGDIAATLKKYRLADLFDEVIQINKTDAKYKYIHRRDAIFIDDSHAERREVQQKCGIPVFDAHSLDVLLEKL